MKILLLYRQKSACDYHRIFMPFRYLPLEDGDSISFRADDEVLKTGDFKDIDIVVFNRHPTVDLDQLLGMKRKYGFKTWVDLDDDWELYEHHYLYKEWAEKKVGSLILRSLVTADIVTVTNSRLLRKVYPVNDKVKIIPNGLPFSHEQFRPEKTESEFTRFMYAGGPSHHGDLKQIQPFFGFCSKNLHFIKKSKFIMAGYDPNYKEEALHKMNDVMKVCPNYETRPALSLNHYMQHYNYCDVALAPIENNKFNYYKSNLKIIEAGCMRVPVMVSKHHPFLDDVEMKDKGIFYCSSEKEWYDIARTFIDYPACIKGAGNLLYDYVKKKYDLVKLNELRKETINFLMEK